MSRQCRDCGVADWQPCICTPEFAHRGAAAEEFDGPPVDAPAFNAEQFATRITIQHAIGKAADALLMCRTIAHGVGHLPVGRAS